MLVYLARGARRLLIGRLYANLVFFVDFNIQSGFKIEKNLLFCKAIKKPEHK